MVGRPGPAAPLLLPPPPFALVHEDLNEHVKEVGGRLTTWPDSQERLMLATRARLQTEPALVEEEVLPLDVFLKKAEAATRTTDAFCAHVVSRLVSMHGPAGSIAGHEHCLQTYLKDEELAYEQIRTNPDLTYGTQIHFEEKAKHMRSP